MAYLDRANIGNAKIEGMLETLGMSEVQYNIALSIFFVTYIMFGMRLRCPQRREKGRINSVTRGSEQPNSGYGQAAFMVLRLDCYRLGDRHDSHGYRAELWRSPRCPSSAWCGRVRLSPSKDPPGELLKLTLASGPAFSPVQSSPSRDGTSLTKLSFAYHSSTHQALFLEPSLDFSPMVLLRWMV